MNIKYELRRIAEKYNLEYTIDNSLKEKLVSPKDVEKYIDELEEMLQRVYNVEETEIIKSECGAYLRMLGSLLKSEEYLKEVVDYYIEKGSLLKVFINKIRLTHTYQWQKDFKKSDELFERLLAEMGIDGAEKYVGIRLKNKEVVIMDREQVIRLWFNMWIDRKDYGIKEIFSENIEYIESWGPRYNGTEEILEWFSEWNRRNRCTDWTIRQFFHKGSQTVVEWYFRCVNKDDEATEFDGMTLVKWDERGRILSLKEFKCDL